MIELPSLIQHVSLEWLCFYEVARHYITIETLRRFSHINFILPTNIKEIRFGLCANVMKVELKDGWKEIDDALSDPRLKNLEVLGVHELGRYYDAKLKSYFQECMPKSYKQGILRFEDNN